jgi:hypothetical protein
MSAVQDRELSVHRQFRVGARVLVLTRWRRGSVGDVIERLDDRVDGLARYGVRLGDGRISDLSRVELRRVAGVRR